MSDLPRILVVYHSRSGTTRRLAEMLASELGADIEAIEERGPHASRAGIGGYLKSAFDAPGNRPVDLMAVRHDLSAYDVVVVGGPVWASHASAPARAWLEKHGARLAHVALFCCMGVRGSDPALQEMAHAARKAPIASCVFAARDLNGYEDVARLHAFGHKIQRRIAALHELNLMA